MRRGRIGPRVWRDLWLGALGHILRGIGRRDKPSVVVAPEAPGTPGPANGVFVDAFLISTGIVALAEIGDKTQLLALILAARYRKPWPIILGILVATLLNHGLAASVGAAVSAWAGPEIMRWVIGLAFVGMGLWCLVPDKAEEGPQRLDRAGPFIATLVAFFLVEIGDKTQIATVALAARFNDLIAVTAGTTLGMMLANAPVVLFGDAIAKRVPLAWVRAGAAAVFVVLGLVTLFAPFFT
jgi:putative Ca2+/H+ antiporter (TMEM165/GDT1 family)